MDICHSKKKKNTSPSPVMLPSAKSPLYTINKFIAKNYLYLDKRVTCTVSKFNMPQAMKMPS
jgi:hypothetical protein